MVKPMGHSAVFSRFSDLKNTKAAKLANFSQCYKRRPSTCYLHRMATDRCATQKRYQRRSKKVTKTTLGVKKRPPVYVLCLTVCDVANGRYLTPERQTCTPVTGKTSTSGSKCWQQRKLHHVTKYCSQRH